MKVVIIGGVAGGATAAARIRRLDEQAEIIVFERSGFISYANCGLPYYIGGTIEDENKLTLQTPESFWRRFRVKVNVHHEVIAIHPDSKTVTVKNLENDKIFTESYDKLLLSPGAKPIKPRFEGIDSDKIFTIRTVEDTLRLKKYTDEHQLKSAVVVGGGFIGIEVAENLHDLGIDITLVEASDQLMAPFDRDMASFIHSEILKNGIHLMLDTMVEGFADTDCGIDVKLKNA
ncbi:MAG: FAD-dependent oxidoreductase, partial [Mollicutes bacterium]|nr:FAD-dependent oxidoreductase [Mollicutes bacterium]